MSILNTLFQVRISLGSLILSRLCAALTALFCIAGSVYAQNVPETNEVQRLLRSGQLDQALQKADAFLATKPRDAQMRFLKALILTEQKRTQEAISLFQKLTEDFPELPEPYNNLAVLYAGIGQYDKARNVLEMAIRTDPRYATAHENLGDVYAKLAGEAYGRALQLDGSNNTAYPKLSLLRDLPGGTHSSTNRPTAPTASTALLTPTPAPTTPLLPTAPAAPTTKAVATPAPSAAPVTPAPVNKPEPVKQAELKPESVKTEPAKPEPKVEQRPIVNQSEEVLKAVRQWAADWSKKDTNAYFSAYSKDFKPSDGSSRREWETERRSRIEGRGKIRVDISQPTISIIGDTAKVNFRQRYRSNKYYNTTRKTLTLTRQSGRWLIVSEVTGD